MKNGNLQFREAFRLRAVMACILLSVVLFSASCGQRSGGDDEDGPFLYYVDETGEGLVRESYASDDLSVETLIGKLSEAPASTGEKALLSGDLEVSSHTLSSGLLILDFTAAYRKLGLTEEVLIRAGVVRTLVQAENVTKVAFTVDGEEAVTPGGVTLGAMDANSFVEDSGRQINAIQNQTIRLYYANESGTMLNTEGRTIYYSASKPLEWAIVERVIAGPKVEGNFATLPSNTQIISVSSSNGICFVNLNRAFTEMALAVDPKIPVYSIVNSLVDNCESIESVQISVEGESNILFRDSIDLTNPLVPDHGIVSDVMG